MRSVDSSTHPRGGAGGFSFLELLFVLALIAGLAAISLAAYSSLIQSTAVTTGADMINDALTEARQDAITQNTAVEVRLYALPASTGAPTSYTALQLHWLKSDGTTPPIKRPLFLPAPVVIDATSAHSPIIAINPQPVPTDASDSHLNNQTRIFHYLPDGSTDLNPATNWFLTVRSATQSDPAHFPSNWACVQVDPTTGHTRIYRP